MPPFLHMNLGAACIFVDGENLRYSLCELFDGSSIARTTFRRTPIGLDFLTPWFSRPRD